MIYGNSNEDSYFSNMLEEWLDDDSNVYRCDNCDFEGTLEDWEVLDIRYNLVRCPDCNETFDYECLQQEGEYEY